MSRHPVTPMDEGDLRVHLDRQTRRRIELIDIAQMAQGLGPDDPAVQQFDDQVRAAQLTKAEGARRIGFALAEIMQRILDHAPVRRIVVAGGDSSGAVASHLGIRSLTVAAGLTPGVPLCRAWSDQARRDGLELVLKGGQLGAVSFYEDVLLGRQSPAA